MLSQRRTAELMETHTCAPACTHSHTCKCMVTRRERRAHAQVNDTLAAAGRRKQEDNAPAALDRCSLSHCVQAVCLLHLVTHVGHYNSRITGATALYCYRGQTSHQFTMTCSQNKTLAVCDLTSMWFIAGSSVCQAKVDAARHALVIQHDFPQVVWERLRLWVTNRSCPLRKFSQQCSRTPSGCNGLSSYTGCLSKFCSQWAFLTPWSVLMDSFLFLRLRVSLCVLTPCPASLPKCSFSVLCVTAVSLSVSTGNAISQSAAAVHLRFRCHDMITWFFHQDQLTHPIM